MKIPSQARKGSKKLNTTVHVAGGRQYLWLAEKLEEFHGVFAARVKMLEANEYEHDQK